MESVGLLAELAEPPLPEPGDEGAGVDGAWASTPAAPESVEGGWHLGGSGPVAGVWRHTGSQWIRRLEVFGDSSCSRVSPSEKVAGAEVVGRSLDPVISGGKLISDYLPISNMLFQCLMVAVPYMWLTAAAIFAPKLPAVDGPDWVVPDPKGWATPRSLAGRKAGRVALLLTLAGALVISPTSFAVGMLVGWPIAHFGYLDHGWRYG